MDPRFHRNRLDPGALLDARTGGATSQGVGGAVAADVEDVMGLERDDHRDELDGLRYE
jgi:hypothetical protein